jgi:hypothetical protein
MQSHIFMTTLIFAGDYYPKLGYSHRQGEMLRMLIMPVIQVQS